MKHKDNRLFVYMHGDAEEQQDFIKQCQENDCFAQEINFMVRQKPLSYYPRSQNQEPLDKKQFFNGERPYFTVSRANPDLADHYMNWTWLESALETGWQGQFGKTLESAVL